MCWCEKRQPNARNSLSSQSYALGSTYSVCGGLNSYGPFWQFLDSKWRISKALFVQRFIRIYWVMWNLKLCFIGSRRSYSSIAYILQVHLTSYAPNLIQIGRKMVEIGPYMVFLRIQISHLKTLLAQVDSIPKTLFNL